ALFLFWLGSRPLQPQREKDIQASAFPHREDGIGYFVDRIFPDRLPAVLTIRPAYARKQQTQVVIDLSRSGHRRAWVSRRILLPHRHRRRNPVDQIGIRFFDTLQKLPSVG